jgi:hypothetical protein
MRCITNKICAEDRDRGCQVCNCDTIEPRTPIPDEKAQEWNPPPIN